MDREIKFRAWDKESKEMHYQSKTCGFHIADEFIGIDYNDDPKRSNEWNGSLNCILLQYTGLKDKSGKEIYEGDIWSGAYAPRRNIVTSVITFYKGSFVLDHYKEPLGTWSIDGEIIGNIYENPELLTNK